MIYTIYIICCLASIYLYLYSSYILNFIFNTNVIRIIFSIYFPFVNFIINITGIKNKILFLNNIKIDTNSFNLFILNHNSILDHLIIFKLGQQNNFGWNNIRTISKISKKETQNKILKIFDSLLINKNLEHDYKNLLKIKKKWLKYNKPFQIILYPEGTIYNSLDKISNKTNNFLETINIRPYKNLLFPYSGIFNLLLENIQFNNIYHFTIVYKLGNKRLSGEKNILYNIAKPNFRIIVSISKTKSSNITKNWLYKNWELSDKLIDKILKV